MRKFLLTLALLATQASALDLIAYTEESAPYNFTKDGKVVGIATELLEQACARLKIQCRIESVPWARAYALAQRTPNTMLFSMVRREDRESSFAWISPISTETVWVFGQPNSPSLHGVEDLKGKRTSVTNGGSAAAFLRSAGVPESALEMSNSIESGLRKLGAHRVDYVVNTEARIEAEKAKFGLDLAITKRLKLYEVNTWFAMHPGSDPKLMQNLKATLNELNANGTRDQLIRKYQ